MWSHALPVLLLTLWMSEPPTAATPSSADAPAVIDFDRQIAPILSAHCVGCHSQSRHEGNLLLDRPSGITAESDSGHAVIPAKSGESLLIERAASDDPDYRMPPATHPALKPDQVDLLRKWVDAGAKWPEGKVLAESAKADQSWWSLQPLRSQPVPQPNNPPAGWDKSPIDRYVLATMREKGLEPSPPADRRTLIRRAYFDLIGLPPSPEEVAAFVNDPAADAYERLIDRLLASPQYGERWGRHWLDVIRFGESNGFEQNHLRDNAWPFRDYVIRSFNEDKPYDRLVAEHLAGDQLDPGNPQVEVGTGFLVAGPFDSVGNQDPVAAAQIRSNTLDDIITATGSAFLGLTIHCARCHDHKFDPIKTADYYRLQSALAGVQQKPRPLASEKERADRVAQTRTIDIQIRAVDKQLAPLKKEIADRIAKVGRESILARYPRPPVSSRGVEEVFPAISAKYVRLSISHCDNPHRAAEIDEIDVWTDGPASRNVALARLGSKATASSTRRPSTNADVFQARNLIDDDLSRRWIAESPQSEIVIELPKAETIHRVFWSSDREGGFAKTGRPISEKYTLRVSLDGKEWTEVASNEGRRPSTPQWEEQLLREAVESAEEQAERTRLEQQRADLANRRLAIPELPLAWIGKFTQPSATFVSLGGDPQKQGEAIVSSSLTTLEKVVPTYELKADAPEGKRRLALAEWITNKSNPLTPRVLANRIWHYHFGRGIVATPSDFGFGGSAPSHAELLDWLANQLHEQDWHLKPLHRLIMTSKTYQQASNFDEAKGQIDADAVYLWRYPPRRLEAESIRDTLLSIAGKLDLRPDNPGGPGFQLYTYTVDNVATYIPLDSVGPETYRRSVYHQNVRAVKVDLLAEYDCPDPSLAAPRREVTVSPLQALTMQNHSFILDMAKSLETRLQREAPQDSSSQVKRGFQLAFGRDPDAAELKASTDLIAKHGLFLFCRSLINANEVIYVY